MDGNASKYPDIGDYALIGNGRCAALVSRHASIDWLCLPRFDSPSVFAAILDADDGGRFRIAPTETFHSKRSYAGPTNVLVTTLRTQAGAITVTDVMPIPSAAERDRQLLPDQEVLRRIECIDGELDVEIVFDPRFQYARRVPKLTHDRSTGLLAVDGGLVVALQTDVDMEIRPGQGARGTVHMREGDVRWASLTAELGPAVVGGLGEAAQKRLDGTREWWHEWISRCSYEGPYEDAVLRSILLLRLLVFAPSGAIVAAPTTSLPEEIGGTRNWDYRYCWLRDSTMTLRALIDNGITDEGQQFMSWMLHATRLTWPKLQVLYTLYGGTRVRERTLHHLEGYRNSAPVRVGNGAHDQLQVDVYGEVLAAALSYVQRGGELDHDEKKMVVGLGKTICEIWKEPDNGIWEVRGERTHHTLSKAFCWVGLDALLKLHEAGVVSVPVDRFQKVRQEIRDAVEEHGWNDEIQSYTATFDGDQVDASLLLMAIYGYREAREERMRKTGERIRERLERNGLLYRYRRNDGMQGSDQGAFGICSFWEIELMARQGRLEEAKRAFEHLLGMSNDVGLFSEEIDPSNGMLLGNFPQAFTHVGLINAADSIARVEKGEEPAEVGTGEKKGSL